MLAFTPPETITHWAAPLLKTFEIAEVHAMPGKSRADRAEGVDHGAIGVNDDQPIPASIHGLFGLTPTNR